jgi:transposase
VVGSSREVELEAENVGLRAENRELRERIEELERRLGQNSSNSSKPPSTDPPMTRQQRRALARERAKKSLRKPGGQPGHEGKHRQMAPPEKVDGTFECLPDACSGCGLVFTGGEAQAGGPMIHQKWELPPIAPLIFEY